MKEYIGTPYLGDAIDEGSECFYYGYCMDEDWNDIFEEIANEFEGQKIKITVEFATDCFMYFEYFNSICINTDMIVVEL